MENKHLKQYQLIVDRFPLSLVVNWSFNLVEKVQNSNAAE